MPFNIIPPQLVYLIVPEASFERRWSLLNSLPFGQCLAGGWACATGSIARGRGGYIASFFFWGGTVVFGVETYYVDMSDGNKKTQDVSEMDRLEESIKFMCGRALEKREAIWNNVILRIKNTTVLFSVCFLEAGDYPKKVYIVYRIETILVQECLQEFTHQQRVFENNLCSVSSLEQHSLMRDTT